MTVQEAQSSLAIVIAKADLSFLERQLAGNLLSRHFGETKIVNRIEIHRALRGVVPRLSDFQFRVAKEALVEKLIPVGSSLDGWHMCANMSEAENAAQFLEEKGRDLMHKAARIREGAAQAFGGQMELTS